MVQSTHSVELVGDRVVKTYAAWDRGEPDREWAALTLLATAAPGLAPEPIRREERGGAPVVVMTRVPGRPLGGTPLDDQQLAALATAMTTLHAVRAPEDWPLRRSGPEQMIPDLVDRVAEPPPGVGAEVRRALYAARAWLASSEAGALTGPPPARAVALADGNIGNVLWDGDRCRLVDFEDAGAGDPAYEVADLLEHVTVWLPGLVQPEALLSCLGYDGGQRARVAAYRRVLASFWLVMLLPGHPGHRRNPRGSLERQAARVLNLLA